MKRIQSSKKKIVIFCCSCSNNIKEDSDNLNFYEQETFFSFIDNFEEKIDFNLTKKKRDNTKSCHYRIKFTFNQKLDCFNFVNKNSEKKRLIHNHKPFFNENQKTNVSFVLLFFIF